MQSSTRVRARTDRRSTVRRFSSLFAGFALLVTGVVAVGTTVASPAGAITQNFTAAADWTVPDGVFGIQVRLIGGGGGDGGTNASTHGHARGGGGGIVTIDMDVSPGQEYHIGIGAAGGNGTGKDGIGTGGHGSGFGYGGSGNTGSVGGAAGGGGASGSYLSVGSGATSVRSRIVAVAGGGGGAGGSGTQSRGGVGGAGARAGATATGDRGGAGGSGTTNTTTGGQGTNANDNSVAGGGGGGGGGWYGGNGGKAGDGNLLRGGDGGGGGAGGSNFVDTDRATRAGSDGAHDNYGFRGSVQITYTVAAETVTTLHATPSPAKAGQEVTLRAEVSESGNSTVPAGTMRFSVDGDPLGSPQSVPSNGVVEMTTTDLPVGTNLVGATFEPHDTVTHRPSSDTTDVEIEALTASLQLSGPPGATAFGEPAPFTAQVSADDPGAPAPTGDVRFFVDGTEVAAPVTLDPNSRATLSPADLQVGVHEVTAHYTGDERFAGVSAGPVDHVVERATPGVTLASSQNPTVTGESVTFTAVVLDRHGDPVPTGVVRFTSDGDLLDTVTLGADGEADLTGSGLEVGAHEIVATYLGDGSFEEAASIPVNQRVDKGDVVVAVTPPAPPTRAGEPVDLEATVHPTGPASGTPTGTIQFVVDGVPLGDPVPVANGGASVRTTELSVGDRRITARYAGDRNFNEAISVPVDFAVEPNPTTVQVVTSKNPIVPGEAVTFTVRVTGDGAGVPTGVVFISIDGVEVDALELSPSGRVEVTVDDLAVGDHIVTASYGGDGSFAGSESDDLTQTVERGRVVLDVGVPDAPVEVGDAVDLTARLAPVAPAAGMPTGEVQFFADDETIGDPVTLVGGTATLRVDGFEVGTRSITAEYAGDEAFEGAAGGPASFRVAARPSTIDLDTSITEGVIGDAAHLTARVDSPSPGPEAPTGTVTFLLNGVPVGDPVEVGPDGRVSMTLDSLGEGVATVRADYSGDEVYRAAGSDPVNIRLVAEPVDDEPVADGGHTVINNSGATADVADGGGWSTSGSRGGTSATGGSAGAGTLPATGSRSTLLTIIGLLAMTAGAGVLVLRRRFGTAD